jgi:hypothetical protein
VKQGTGARIGREQGTDALLMGDVTTWAHDDSGGNVNVGFLKFGKNTKKFVVVVTYRLLDAETNEFIATGKARGESVRDSKGGSIGIIGAGKQSKNVEELIRAEALENCLKDLGTQLEKQSGEVRRHARAVEASVLDLTGSKMTIGAGDNEAIAVGDVFEISHITKTLIDPRTQEKTPLKEKIGEMTVTSVAPTFATGNYTGAAAKATVDYIANKKGAEQ